MTQTFVLRADDARSEVSVQQGDATIGWIVRSRGSVARVAAWYVFVVMVVTAVLMLGLAPASAARARAAATVHHVPGFGTSCPLRALKCPGSA